MINWLKCQIISNHSPTHNKCGIITIYLML
nr:MAG TPA: hypothetical protein [Caudoviricetes sp.]